MRSVRGTLNRVELVGWLGQDPEHRFLTSGTSVATFSVATKRPAGKDEAGEQSVETEWTSVEAWEKLAERCAARLHKGSRVWVSGSLRTQSWEDKESGQKRYKTVVRADEVMYLDPRPESGDEE